jgi:hypothetical protein
LTGVANASRASGDALSKRRDVLNASDADSSLFLQPVNVMETATIAHSGSRENNDRVIPGISLLPALIQRIAGQTNSDGYWWGDDALDVKQGASAELLRVSPCAGK